ncbi:MAG: hypothetical protein EOP04_31860 [Proteobacteria bacterium]|nr:MAG: hypothetical protein EOP04_31860 [Pseudomonadota bacterium]
MMFFLLLVPFVCVGIVMSNANRRLKEIRNKPVGIAPQSSDVSRLVFLARAYTHSYKKANASTVFGFGSPTHIEANPLIPTAEARVICTETPASSTSSGGREKSQELALHN